MNDPTILVTSYTANTLTHTLDLNNGDHYLVSGLIYKFTFQATNSIGTSLFSDFSSFALCDRPLAPGVPTIIPTMTNANQIAISWDASADTQTPGGNVYGYIIYIMDPALGYWTEVFNGELDYPTVRSFIVRYNITGGIDYSFKVRAAYKNGYTVDSQASFIYACT